MPAYETAFRKGFETQKREVSIDNLTVRGSIPDWLQGIYIHNGPGQFDLEHDKYWHWFDGLAMPHRFKFEDGKVSFANRYLQTVNYQVDNENQKLNFRMSATDPKRTFWQKCFAMFHMDFTDNTNVHTIQMDGEYVALTERQLAWTFDPDTLEIKHRFKYDNSIGHATQTAHQHYDPVTRTHFNLALHNGIQSTYIIYAFKNRRYTPIAKIPTEQPSYMHSFGMTENYIILTEFPYLMTRWSMLEFLFTDTPYLESFAWRPQEGTIISVISKTTGEVVQRMQADAFFSFHHINAFERSDTVVIDIAAYPDSSIIQGLYVDTMKLDREFTTTTAEFRRYTIPLHSKSKSNSIGYEVASGDRIILPRINYNHYNAKPYRYAYGVSTRDDIRDFTNEIVKIDTESGDTVKRWHIDGHYPAEPIFAPRPNAKDEDDGLVMSTVYNSCTGTSYLLLLDAKTFDVYATADTSIRIPFSFHGRWYPNGNMYAL